MAQVNKISSFKSFTEVKNQEATMKLRETNNAKRQETVGKIGAILDEMGLTSLSELDEEKKQALINKMFGNVSEDEADDIEDELNKLGEPKKLEERNAFLGARAKAIEEEKNEFEFNGKTYKVTVNEGNAFGDAVRKAKEDGKKEFEFDGKTYKVEEGNAFGDAVRKAKEAGEKEFEFDGKTYKVEESIDEAKRTKFTGKTAHDLYTQTGGKPFEVFVKNDWYSVNPEELKDDKDTYFTGYTRDGSDYEFDLKDIDFIQESLNEGRVKAATLLQELIDGNTSRAEGIKMSKDLAEHYLYWLRTSPYGKKNADLPLYMLIKASFVWGIERQLDPKLKVELEALKGSIKESADFITEARSINKIQYDWSKLTTTMAATAQNWKTAEGPAKEMLLGKLKEMTAQKKALEAELDAAIADKDKDIELVVSEAFFRLPKDVIGNELYLATQNLSNLYGRTLAGNDIDAGVIDTVIKALNTVKKSIKKFNNKEEVLGTVYEAKAKDLKPNHKYTSDYGEVTFIKLNPDGKTMKLHSKETGEIKTDISNAYNMELIESVVNEGDMTKHYDGFILLDQKGKKTYKFKYVKGTSNVNVENAAIDKLVKATGEPRANFMVHGFIKKGEWDKNNISVFESLNEGSAKQFDVDFNNMVRNIKSGYGWIDPEYVADTWENSSDSIDFELVKGEIYKRLIAAKLLAYADDEDEEAAGQYVKSLKELGIKESFINEAEKFKSTQDFEEFLEEIDGMPEHRIKRIMGKDYIDTPGGFRDEADDYDNDIVEYTLSNMGRKDFEALKAWWENNVQESLNEAEVKSDDEFKEYAMTVLKKAFGDDFDEAKATEVIDGILGKCGDDYGAAVGMITSSLGESVVTEGIWPKSKLASSFQFKLADELKQNFKGVFYSIGNDLYHNDEKVYSIDGDKDSIDSIISKLKKTIDESVVTEGFDANYWEDYQEGAQKTKNPTAMVIMQDVQAAVEEWNENNEVGPENEVTPAGEKKVLKLAKEFVKAKGWISFDIIDAMIAQES